MHEELELLRVATRVIAAATEHREPEETDVKALRSYAPLFMHKPPDVLACEVIQQVLKERGRIPNLNERAERV
jgi:hypothetical protein